MPNEPQTNQSDALCTTVCVSGCLSDDHIHDTNSDDMSVSGSDVDSTMQSDLAMAEVPNFTESCVIPRNYVDPVIPVEQLLQQQNTAPQIPFPHITSPPVNMFQQEQLEEHAFPVLYPKGRFGLGHDRSKHLY